MGLRAFRILFVLFVATNFGTLAYEKCSSVKDCEQFLETEDQKNPAIFGYCTKDMHPGTCVINYIWAPGIGLRENIRDSVGPNCTRLTSHKTCEKATAEIPEEYPAFNRKSGHSFSCKATSAQGKQVTYHVCSAQATQTEELSNAVKGETSVKSGCTSADDCEKILTEEDKGNRAILKSCYEADKDCKEKCDYACGFTFAKVFDADLVARNPNPSKCKHPHHDQKEMVKKACERGFASLNAVFRKTDNTQFGSPGFICGPNNYITCVAQVTPKDQSA